MTIISAKSQPVLNAWQPNGHSNLLCPCMLFILGVLSPASSTPSPAVSCAITPPVWSAFDGASRWKPAGMLRAHDSKHTHCWTDQSGAVSVG